MTANYFDGMLQLYLMENNTFHWCMVDMVGGAMPYFKTVEENCEVSGLADHSFLKLWLIN